MKSVAVLFLLLPLVCTAVRGEEAAASAPEEILDAPGGKPIAILLAGAVRNQGETRDGYVRVRVEGWIRLPGTAPPAVAPARAPLPAPAVSSAVPLSGIIVTTLPSGEARYGSGAKVVLLGRVPELDAAWSRLKEGYDRERADLEARTEDLKLQEKSALSSTDNMTQASQKLDRVRKMLRQAQQEKQDLKTRYATRADELFRTHQAAETVADAEGRYAFSNAAPGSYRLLAIQTLSGAAATWYLPVEVPASGGAIRDLRSSDPGSDPYFGTR